jgi:hypothetical protein
LDTRTPGPADPAMLVEQIHTFGACNPSGLENCHDLQMSVHEAR